jgi:hypothetical protein
MLIAEVLTAEDVQSRRVPVDTQPTSRSPLCRLVCQFALQNRVGLWIMAQSQSAGRMSVLRKSLPTKSSVSPATWAVA